MISSKVFGFFLFLFKKFIHVKKIILALLLKVYKKLRAVLF